MALATDFDQRLSRQAAGIHNLAIDGRGCCMLRGCLNMAATGSVAAFAAHSG